MYKDTKFDLIGEQWEVKFLPKVAHNGKRVAGGVYHKKKLILISTEDDDGNILPEEKVKEFFTKAITPIAYKLQEAKQKEQDGIQ